MRRNQWAAALFALLLFCCGVAAGVLADRYYDIEGVAAKANSPENVRKHYIADMRSRLNLTPAQVAQLEGIMDETNAQFRAVREKCHPEMVQVHREHIAHVKAILNARQIPIYEQMVKEHQEQERKKREQENHPHGH